MKNITKNFSREDLLFERVEPIEVYEDLVKHFLFKPLNQLSKNRESNTVNGYSLFVLGILFFEPHGKFLLGEYDEYSTSNKNIFLLGLNPFLDFLQRDSLLDHTTRCKIRDIDFYDASRCGIFHDMKIKKGILLDLRRKPQSSVFYMNPTEKGIVIDPWNFIEALQRYFDLYLKELKKSKNNDMYKNFLFAFNKFFEIE